MLIFDQLNRADRHLRVLSWVIAAGLCVLVGGLWWIQVIQARSYAEDLRTQSYRTVRVPAPRGKILDRQGIALAENEPVYSISLYLDDPSWRKQVQQYYKTAKAELRRSGATTRPPTTMERIFSWFGRKPTLVKLRSISRAEDTKLAQQARFNVTSNIVARIADAIGKPLTIDEKQFHRHYQQRLALPLPIATELSITNLARFQERGLQLPGVDLDVQPLRIYPQGTMAAHVVGYLTRNDDSAQDELSFYNYRLPDYRGLAGIEASFDRELRGKAGAMSVLVNSLGYRQSETTLSQMEPGKDITLTLDAEIQRVAERGLAEIGARARSAAVVLDTQTGEVLAIASTPVFNPNDWIPYLPHATWNTYTNEEVAPLQNRAIYGHFAPGSVFKIVVAIAGLEAGTLDTNEIIHVEPNPAIPGTGLHVVSGRGFKDTAPPGPYNFRKAFIKSSNTYFIEHGLRVKPDPIVFVGERLGFGERSGIPLAESKGLLPTAAWVRENMRGWSPVAVANLSIGQGALDVTPLQVAVAMAAIANGGRVLKPQLVLNVRRPNELRLPTDTMALPPIVRRDARLNPTVLQVLHDAMLADVEDPDGTAYKAFHRPDTSLSTFRVGGKTGTAQVTGKDGHFDHHTVWFASFGGLAHQPTRYAVVVMGDSGGSGGGTCAPIAAKIYRALEQREQRLQYSNRPVMAIN